MLRRIGMSLAVVLLLLAALIGIAVWAIGMGGVGRVEHAGEVTATELPASWVAAGDDARRRAGRKVGAFAPGDPDKQILFGDLHVHTTFSNDAFFFSLPMMQGEGAHPPADACDSARFCSSLDFFSINDHAELITPRQWSETKDSIRQCNEVAGDPANPDLVAFLGWEWTQMGKTPEEHFGHKNVVLRDIEEGAVPRRPIAARRGELSSLVLRLPMFARVGMGLLDAPLYQRYADFSLYAREAAAVPVCEEGVDTRELPGDCIEYAPTPKLLFEKLDQWGFPSLVIPHGLTWGIHAPPGADLSLQLRDGMNDPSRQRLLEVYSGHGTSEEATRYEHQTREPDGGLSCPEPRDGFTPCCWRAGELVRERCTDVAEAVCEERVENARQRFVEMGSNLNRFAVVEGTSSEEWLDCGQHPGFMPSSLYRPKMAAQYGLVRREFDVEEEGGAFRFGFIAASDNHYARAGTGYKEVGLHGNTDARGIRTDFQARLGAGGPRPRRDQPLSLKELRALGPLASAGILERGHSFLYTGGLAAVHSSARDRVAIFDALERRETYATSGDRILLWFHLLNGPGGPVPMGSEVSLARAPRFRVRAVGAFEQRPGCPDHSLASLAPERLTRLCKDECYHPSDTRKVIDRIEVVRIRPQSRPAEPLESLIDDPWLTYACPGDPTGCSFEFEDPTHLSAGREALYYVRVLQRPSLAINAGNLRCTRDEAGRCIEVDPCFAAGPKETTDDCLGELAERAWSSPIYLR